MKRRTKFRKRTNGGTMAWTVVKAALLSCLSVLVLMLLYTLALYLEWFSEEGISVFNAVVKVLGAALAGFIVGMKATEKAWLWGALAAGLFQLLAIGGVCLFLGEAELNWGLMGDVLMSAVLGAALAAVTAMLREKKEKPA